MIDVYLSFKIAGVIIYALLLLALAIIGLIEHFKH